MMTEAIASPRDRAPRSGNGPSARQALSLRDFSGNPNEADHMAQDIEERAARRVALGDDVITSAIGHARVLSASGILLAFRRGVLDGESVPADFLRQIGELYRSAYEAVNAMLTAQKNEVRGSGGLGVQDAVLAHGATLARLRKRQTAKHVDVLDVVCGQDLTVNRAAIAFKVDPRTVERRLREALVTGSHNWGIA